MIYMYTDHHKEEITRALSEVEGLEEIAQLKSLADVDDESNHLIVTETEISTPLPWDNSEPPILFKPRPFNTNDLIAIILSKLGYEEEALAMQEGSEISNEIRYRLQLKTPDQQVTLSTSGNDYFSTHNHAIINHYASHFHNGAAPEALYSKAISNAPNDEYAAFSARHLATLFIDNGDNQKAEKLLKHHHANALSDCF